ncbi:hypothetical protein COLO4_37255 [Corchorus olitorius]|uniref:Uncharacterized protein n=1 Tax=Corchorus olitorius TaxID=93759 RepID=A0A1R3G2Q2_9ROSI|nr:hypothetical protein COLO4_37255 [Corchorus olitorius]
MGPRLRGLFLACFVSSGRHLVSFARFPAS